MFAYGISHTLTEVIITARVDGVSQHKMATCESTRTRAYDSDMRWRMVYQRLVLNLPFKTISQNLCVDISTVRRILRLFQDTNSVRKRQYPEQHARQRRKLTESAKFQILELVVEHPGIQFGELRQNLLVAGTNVSEATISRFLHCCGFSRARYVTEVSLHTQDMLVFIDETGSDRRGAMRKFGYSMQGRIQDLTKGGSRVVRQLVREARFLGGSGVNQICGDIKFSRVKINNGSVMTAKLSISCVM